MIQNRSRVDPMRRLGSLVVLGLVAAAAVAGALAGCHPTRTPVLDPLYSAVLAGVVVLAASIAPRGTVLWLAAVSVALSRGWLTVPAAAGLLAALAGVFVRRRSPWLDAISSAVAVQIVLRWPHMGFHGATAAVAAVAVLPVLVGATWSLPPTGRRVVLWAGAGIVAVTVILAVPVAIQGLRSRQAVNAGITAAESALQQVKQGEAGTARGQLDRAASDFETASQRLGSWWTSGARVVPVAAQQRQALAVASDVARRVSEVARDQSGQINFGQLRYGSGSVDLGQVTAMAQPLEQVHAELVSAEQRLHALRSPWIVAPIESRLAKLNGQLGKAESSTRLAGLAVDDAPSLLGAHTTRHYFVAFTEPAESRGLGGTLLWYADLSITDGKVDIGSFGDAHNLADALAARGGGKLTGPADYLARYGKFDPQNNFIDLTYSPDLPTVTDVVSQLYSQLGKPPVDGMMVLDSKSLAGLIAATGPLEVPGLGTLTAQNTVDVLDREQYALYPSPAQYDTRKAVLDDALHLAAQRLSSPALLSVRGLLDDIGPSVATGDFLFWSVHPTDQPLLVQTGLAGSFPAAVGGDVLSVVTQNAANNKIDAYLQRDIDDHVVYDPSSGAVSATVKVTLHNTAPASGLSWEVLSSYSGSGLPSGSDLLWVSLYSPFTLVRSDLGSAAWPATSTPELGFHTYSGYVAVPSGASRTVTFQLSGRLRPGSDYRLTLHQQPTVLPDRVVATVTPAKGSKAAGAAQWPVPAALDPSHDFAFRRVNS
ncbi:MAG: DUF4012 domain-containing protein [Acidimicrobiales bacterium]|nr:DUF4012 domain-containing protein [Acidimicrobiales bacterium]